MIKFRDILIEFYNDTKEWYHGSPSGDLGGGEYGLHLGTFKAAKEALENNINFGIFYKNVVEDTGSISVVVSNRNCVKEV